MTKAVNDFAEQDRELVARVLWLLDVHPPRPVGRVLDLLGVGEPAPILHFALSRWIDAQRSAPEVPEANILKLQATVIRHEKAARDDVAEAVRLLKRAGNYWVDSVVARDVVLLEARRQQVESCTAIGLKPTAELPLQVTASGDPQRRTAHEFVPAIAAAAELLSALTAYLPKEPPGRSDFPSLLGLSLDERNHALHEQAARLEDAGVSADNLAYVFTGQVAMKQSEVLGIRDRIGQRIRIARSRWARAYRSARWMRFEI
ncbi:MAG TPA: hypothetical protein VGC79_12365 [Polyangiaceae bacterium]